MSLGEFENSVLAAALILKPDAYGASIRRLIHERTGQEPPIGQVYTAITRLEGKGFVVIRVGEKTPVRGGSAKKYVDITNAGLRTLTESMVRMQAMWRDLYMTQVEVNEKEETK